MDLFALLFGFYKKIYDLATYTSIVWLTCLNYWNNPKKKFNYYYLDIITVRSGILYHIIRVPDAENYLTSVLDQDSLEVEKDLINEVIDSNNLTS